jgi:prephenate dehydrogenase
MEKENGTILNIGVVGLGLIGGSYIKAIKTKTPHKVFGYNRGVSVTERALKEGFLDGVLDKSSAGILDILIFCVSPKILDGIIFDYLAFLKPGCIVTDACGLKKSVMELFKAAKAEYPRLEFIGSHPMAGKEVSGYENAEAGLFENAGIILTPLCGVSPYFTERLKVLYSELGFKKAVQSSAEEHDRVIAYTSQGCHAVSVAYALNPLYRFRDGFSAGSLRDLTRVAKTDSALWTELFCSNADNLAAVLDEFISALASLKNAIAAKDEKTVRGILDEANAVKKE